MLTKSLVQGRSDGLDSLLLKYQRRLQSKYFGGNLIITIIIYTELISQQDLSAGELSMGNFDQTVPAQADSDQHKLSHKTPHHHAVHHQAHNEIDPDIDIIVDKLLRNPPKPLAASTYRDVKHQTNLFRIKDFLLTVLNVQQRQQQQRLHLNSTSATAAAAASIPQPKSSSNKQAATAGASSTAATTAQQPVRKSRPRKTATDPTAAAATVQRQFGASSATTYPPNAPQTQQQQQPAPSTQPVAVTTSHTMDPRDLKFA
jgi:hypothetical protein